MDKKRLLCKHEKLSSNPSIHIKSGTSGTIITSASCGQVERRESEAYWLATLAVLTISGCIERSHLKK